MRTATLARPWLSALLVALLPGPALADEAVRDPMVAMVSSAASGDFAATSDKLGELKERATKLGQTFHQEPLVPLTAALAAKDAAALKVAALRLALLDVRGELAQVRAAGQNRIAAKGHLEAASRGYLAVAPYFPTALAGSDSATRRLFQVVTKAAAVAMYSEGDQYRVEAGSSELDSRLRSMAELLGS